MNIILPEYVNELVEAGIQLTIEKGFNSQQYEWYIDVHTGAKSHLHLTFFEGRWQAFMRYDTVKDIESLNDLLYAVKNCMCGRDYIDSNWVNFLVERGMMIVETTTVTTYK